MPAAQLTATDEIPTSAAVNVVTVGMAAKVLVVATMVLLLAMPLKFKASIPICMVVFGCSPDKTNAAAATPWLEKATVEKPSVETCSLKTVPVEFPFDAKLT